MDQNEFDGAFAALSTPETPDEPVADVEPDEPADEPDAEDETADTDDTDDEPNADEPVLTDEAQAYLARYGGNTAEALKAAAHLTSKIGEQGYELSALRKEVDELRNRPEPRPNQPFVPSDMQEAIEQAPDQVAVWAAQNENWQAYEAAMDEWFQQDAKAASRFERAMERQQVKQEVLGEVQPDMQAFRKQQQQRATADAHRVLSQQYPDFQQILETATEQELAGIDRAMLQQSQASNPQAAFELVYRWVRAGREQQAAQKAERTEKGRKAKREAAVVTSDTAKDDAPPSVMDRLRDQMLSPEPQSVLHGMTGQ